MVELGDTHVTGRLPRLKLPRSILGPLQTKSSSLSSLSSFSSLFLLFLPATTTQRLCTAFTMAITVDALETTIRQILTAPGTDLSTISAKRVRKQLPELDSSVTPDFVKDHKDAIDEVIARVYQEISASQENADEEDVPLKRKREDASEGEPSAAPKKPKKSKTKQEQADEDLARQLQTEMNGRSRSSRAASSKTKSNGTKKRGKKSGAKSSATVNSDGEQESGEDKPKKRGGGFKKEYALRSVFRALLFVPSH